MGKNHNFGQILTFLGVPVSTTFYQWGPNLVCYSRPAVRAKFHLNVFIVSASGGQKLQFLGKFWHFWGLLYRPPFTDEGRIWSARADPWSTLTGQISSECVHFVRFRWPKTTILGKFWHFWELLSSPKKLGAHELSWAELRSSQRAQKFELLWSSNLALFYRWGPNLVCYSRPTL